MNGLGMKIGRIGIPRRSKENSAVSVAAGPHQNPPIRWAVVVPIIVVSGGSTVFSVYASYHLAWKGFAPSVFLQLGSTVLLGVILFLLQRVFVVIPLTERTERIETAVSDQATALESLSGRVSQLTGERHEDEDAVVEAVGNQTYEDVSRALIQAELQQSIYKSFRVRASTDPLGLRLFFKPLRAVGRGVPDESMIVLTPWFPDRRSPKRISWMPVMSVEQVFSQLVEKLEDEHLDTSEAMLDPDLVMENLSESLRVAQAARRSEIPMTGALVELFDADWAFTSQGLIARADGAPVVRRAQFPNTIPSFRAPGAQNWQPAPSPPSVDPGTWSNLMTIGEKTFQILI